MTVKELIEKLKQFPETANVYMYDHDSEGYVYEEEVESVDEYNDGKDVVLN